MRPISSFVALSLIALAACPGAGDAPIQGITGEGGGGGGTVAAQLVFTVQPTTTVAGQAITPSVRVTVEDSAGATVAGATDPITMTLGATATDVPLHGTTTVTPVSGIAVFSDLSIDSAGTGYSMVATSGALQASSASFDVTKSASGAARPSRRR
ncbi:MAG TPA: hypothetical protein VFK78_07950 [Gemmatimonadales bacterium]|nr:hypothetical protein [Gemmatimonadales bacterium]